MKNRLNEINFLLAEKNILVAEELNEIEEITVPQTYFSQIDDYQTLEVLYISDMHLEHHLKKKGIGLNNQSKVAEYFDGIIKNMLSDDVVQFILDIGISGNRISEMLFSDYAYIRRLYRNLNQKEFDALMKSVYNGKRDETVIPLLKKILVFNGDIADDIRLVSLFFDRFFWNLENYQRQNCEKIKDGHCPILFVIGNHECINYEIVDEAVSAFETELNQYGIHVLHNKTIEFGNCVILGGTGFAQYNEEHNASNLLCARKMMGNREYEISEGQEFEDKYYAALKLSYDKELPLIVFSHYPVKDWLGDNTNGRVYYFTGHNHLNSIFVSEKGHIYSDNQIGYTNENFKLKKYSIGTIYNPFVEYDDGYYEITTQQYEDFYLYNGETVSAGLIEKAIQNGNRFFMIKRNGFYGFFLINNARTQICAGGRPKNISEIADIEYFYNCFNLMIYQYVSALKPYRKFQEKISNEIKKLDIPSTSTGRIHGCIVDVDFLHHVMINPFCDGTITFYYSPIFGLVQNFDSFENLLESVESIDNRLFGNKREYLERKEAFLKDKSNILSRVTNKSLIGEMNESLVCVETSGGMYSFSRRMNQLQRLFSANILRDWDNNLIGQLLGISDVDSYVSDKKLTDYQLVQKHWKNLQSIESSKIDEKLVKYALRWDRKHCFPYMDTEKTYGTYYGRNPMNAEGIKEFINHIPKSVLKKTVEDFYYRLNVDLLKYYPLDCIEPKELSGLLSDLTGKKVVEILECISPDWSDSFGTCIAERMNQKNRPPYCSKELWNKIRSFDQSND